MGEMRKSAFAGGWPMGFEANEKRTVAFRSKASISCAGDNCPASNARLERKWDSFVMTGILVCPRMFRSIRRPLSLKARTRA